MIRAAQTIVATVVVCSVLTQAVAQSDPAAEAAVRRMTEELLRGELRYDLMTEDLAQIARGGERAFVQMVAELGPFDEVTFVETAPSGADVFDVKHARGILRWTVKLTPDGKTSTASLRRFLDLRAVPAAPASGGEGAAVQSAIDSVLEAFERHPVVALGDDHGLAQEMGFYAALIRDLRFARDVGNVVVEFGAAGRQQVIDRYLAGEIVPYSDLRTVWTDVVGWVGTAGNLGFAKFFAAVRAVNRTQPPEHRIRVWLGEPPIDWSTAVRSDFMRAITARDSHPADIVEQKILAAGAKALVIYGNFHLAGSDGTLRARVETEHPDAFFVVLPYSDNHKPPACEPFLRRAARLWPTPAVAAPVAGGVTDPAMRDCATWNGGLSGLGTFVLQRDTPGATASVSAPSAPAQVDGDAVLFLGALETLTRSPPLPDYFLDTEYRRELGRRREIGGFALLPFPPNLALRRADYEADLDAPGYVERLDSMFAEHDRNGDGVVTADEYVDPVP